MFIHAIPSHRFKTNYEQMKLVWDVPGQDRKGEALQIALAADVVILCIGLSPYLEGEEMKVEVEGFACGDRVEIFKTIIEINIK